MHQLERSGGMLTFFTFEVHSDAILDEINEATSLVKGMERCYPHSHTSRFFRRCDSILGSGMDSLVKSFSVTALLLLYSDTVVT